MNTERLRILADFLQTVPVENFNIASWRNKDSSTYVPDDNLFAHECGTTAYAVGWACTIPEFKAAGLEYGGMPMFERRLGWSAVRAFFDIDAKDAHELFDLAYYPYRSQVGPKTVAEKIYEFIG